MWDTLGGVGAMVLVGSSIVASSSLVTAPLFTAQGLRYAMAAGLLVGAARLSGRRVRLPHGVEWLWLAAVAGAGLVVFNVALVHGVEHAEPAVLGVAIACVPLLLALGGPLLDGQRPAGRLLGAAALVTVGAAMVEGFGHTDAAGLAWAAVVFAGEAGFTLFAVPVLRTLGPYGVSVHTTWMAAGAFAVLGVVTEGAGAVTDLPGRALLATVYLAVAVTAVAFVLWYGCVQRVGAGRAGLLTGIAPIAATVGGVVVGGPVPALTVWLGVLVVAVGLAVGLGRR
ncbi:Integral membrane protein [Nostocoides japonicum T1-X7]|uniref:Integral membrane protein n=1 Tax=Nostocoides japonicum T1-X7 TaxID=1194083 RepID=A0A077LYG0_9MICO|nr:Integral membrane protein [Tetrasphaera japonica T1-X7]